MASEKLWKVIWGSCFPPKIQHFFWRACTGALATKSNLCKRRCGHEVLCSICLQEEETVDHMLLSCDWAHIFWFGCGINNRIRLEEITSFGRWREEWLVKNVAVDDVTRCFLGFVCWFIWKERCSFFMENNDIDPEVVCVKINHFAAEFLTTNGLSAGVVEMLQNFGLRCVWVPPPYGFLKVNSDGASRNLLGRKALG